MPMLAALALAAIFTDYPAFLRRGEPIEAIIDRGPINELVVRCSKGTGILTYSKLEHLYCASTLACFDTFEAARRATCG